MSVSAGEPRRVPGTGIDVHPFAVDGSVFGWASGVEETSRILDVMLDYGGNLVSTADHYAGGRSEVMIGGWLKTVADRSQVLVSTKIGRHPDAAGLSPRTIVRAAEASLLRLETDYVDFLTLDGVDPDTPIDETLEAVDMLRRAGKARWMAVSRYPPSALHQITELAESAAYPRITLALSTYNLMQRTEHERDIGGTAPELGIGVVAREPLASGFLSGEFRSKSDVPSSPLFANALEHLGKRGRRVLDAVEAIADEQGETPGRVALGWLLSKPAVIAAALRVRSAEQLSALSDPGEIVLRLHQVAVLDRVTEH